MFDIIKKEVNLVREIEKDLGVTLRLVGDKNWVIDGDKDVEKCPFCSHHDCFRVHYIEGDNSSAFFKCFSCSASGDVTTWRSKYFEVDLKTAARELAAAHNLKLPTSFNPIQQVFTLAAEYYHNCLVDSCNYPLPFLGGKTPLEYQLEVRGRKESSLYKHKVGFSDGGLVDYLESLGIDPEVIEASGLKSPKANGKFKDYLPQDCFIYPHFVDGKASHFTFKDPTRRKQYQLPKKYTLNGYMFYGQDSFQTSEFVTLVEGENDLLAVDETGLAPCVMATIGSLSLEQIDWLKSRGAGKTVVTLFDPDDAGDGYREKIQGIRPSFAALLHVRPPDDKDIDELLVGGAKLEDIIRDNRVTVQPKIAAVRKQEPAKNVTTALTEMISELAPAPLERVKLADRINLVTNEVTIAEPPPAPAPAATFSEITPIVECPPMAEEPEEEIDPDRIVEIQGCSVIQMNGAYYKRTYKDDKETIVRISDFTLRLINVYLKEDTDESGVRTTDRHREVILRKSDGSLSEPFMVDSERKVFSKHFKVLVAKIMDCYWAGGEAELAGMWEHVYQDSTPKLVKMPKQAGRHETLGCWIFKNVLISKSGVTFRPDRDGVFWVNGNTQGIRPEGFLVDSPYFDGIPVLDTSLTEEQTSEMLGVALSQLEKNLGSRETALISLGWLQSCVYSDEIFRAHSGMGMLLIWGLGGGGKSTISEWLQAFYGLANVGATGSVNQLQKSTVGFHRKGGYYSSLPMALDELRGDEPSKALMGMIRSWYDREGRTLASGTSNVRNQQIRSTLILTGEDVPDDPATASRLLRVRIPGSLDPSREMFYTYEWFEEHKKLLGNIGYRWILESTRANPKEILQGISELDKELIAAGCSKRISKIWAAAGYFGKLMSQKYYPDYDYVKNLVKICEREQDQQVKDSTVNLFLETIETVQARENTPLTKSLIMRKGFFLYLWYPAVYREVYRDFRDATASFTKNMILRAMKDEPWFLRDDQKISMGNSGEDRRVVITIDLRKAPDVLRRIARYDDQVASTEN